MKQIYPLVINYIQISWCARNKRKVHLTIYVRPKFLKMKNFKLQIMSLFDQQSWHIEITQLNRQIFQFITKVSSKQIIIMKMNRVNNSTYGPMRRRNAHLSNLMSSIPERRSIRRPQHRNRGIIGRTAFRNTLARGPAAQSISTRKMAAARTLRRPMMRGGSALAEWPVGDRRSSVGFARRAHW